MALDFDAVDDYVSLANLTVTTTTFTITLWAAIEGAGGGISGRNAMFEQRDDVTADNKCAIELRDGNFFIRSTNGVTQMLVADVPGDGLPHFCVLRVAAANIYAYVDNVQTDTDTNNQLGNYTTSIDHIDIAREAYTGATRGLFNGPIFDVRSYNRALSVAEIAAIYYARGADNIVNGLVGRWLLNEKPDGSESGPWFIYPDNPILIPTGEEPFVCVQSVLKYGNKFYLYYSTRLDSSPIGRAYSDDGKNWTKDSEHNPILSLGSPEEWDDDIVGGPIVWYEEGVGPDTNKPWKMLYCGRQEGGEFQLGLAESADGYNFAKYAGNPVYNELGAGRSVECQSLIKVNNTYYLWYCGSSPSPRYTRLATSANLVSWSPDGNNPIFNGDYFDADCFKYGNHYYLVISKYTLDHKDKTQFELFRDTSPTFYSTSREFIKVIKTCPDTGWDSLDEEHHAFMTDNIKRDSFEATNGELWTYYAGWESAASEMKVGLLIESSIIGATAFIQDISGNGNHGSPVNSPVYRAAPVRLVRPVTMVRQVPQYTETLEEKLALLENLPGLDRALSLQESLALKEDLTQYARGLLLEESIALKEEEKVSISSLLTESLALKESLPTLERGLTLEEALALLETLPGLDRTLSPLEESLALKEDLPVLERGLTLTEALALLESETADIHSVLTESLALKEDLTQLGRALTLEESLALLEEAHAETLLFKVDKDGNIIIPKLKDAGDAYMYIDPEGKLHRGGAYP